MSTSSATAQLLHLLLLHLLLLGACPARRTWSDS